jgi:hypothetical protein
VTHTGPSWTQITVGNGAEDADGISSAAVGVDGGTPFDGAGMTA